MIDAMTGIRTACAVAAMPMTWLLSALLAACAGPAPAPGPEPAAALAPAAAPAPALAPVPAPAPAPPPSARQNAERWVAAEGLGDRMNGPGATIGIGSASLGKGSAGNPDARRMALRSAELDARGAIARTRGERVAVAADASGSASVTASTDVVSLRGVSVIQTEEVTDPDGTVEFAVVVRADPPTPAQPVAVAPPAATPGAPAPNPAAAPADRPVVRLDVPPAQWAKSVPVDELARSMGARRVAGPDGVVHIMAFGQATARSGRDAMAREKARMQALTAIRQFIDEDVSVSSAASEQSTRTPDGKVTPQGSATQVSETSSSRAMVLPGTSTIFQWRMPNPDGSTSVGVVLLAKDPAAPREAPAAAATNAP